MNLSITACRRRASPVASLWDVVHGLQQTASTDSPTTPCRDEWQSILTEAEWPPERVHDLRHTAATNPVAAGVDPRVRQRLMGWSQDMPVYEHLAADSLNDWGRRLSAGYGDPSARA
jgi:integrase